MGEVLQFMRASVKDVTAGSGCDIETCRRFSVMLSGGHYVYDDANKLNDILTESGDYSLCVIEATKNHLTLDVPLYRLAETLNERGVVDEQKQAATIRALVEPLLLVPIRPEAFKLARAAS